MRKESLIFLISASLIISPNNAQPTRKNTQNTSSQHRTVTLETVLACSEDSLIQSVFETDAHTARYSLAALFMVLAKAKADPEYIALKSKGFVTQILDASSLEILPTESSSGNIAPLSDLPFCHSRPTAHYDDSHLDPGPNIVVIDGQGWIFNTNEIFAHADQFHFDSGVFSNSSDVYFTATKGRTSIQFISKPNGLKLYRSLYSSEVEQQSGRPFTFSN